MSSNLKSREWLGLLRRRPRPLCRASPGGGRMSGIRMRCTAGKREPANPGRPTPLGPGGRRDFPTGPEGPPPGAPLGQNAPFTVSKTKPARRGRDWGLEVCPHPGNRVEEVHRPTRTPHHPSTGTPHRVTPSARAGAEVTSRLRSERARPEEPAERAR